MALDHKVEPELINVHKIYGHKEVIRFLKNSGHEFVEGLFYNAKHTGSASFIFADVRYDLLRNNDGSFTAAPTQDIDYSTESLA